MQLLCFCETREMSLYSRTYESSQIFTNIFETKCENILRIKVNFNSKYIIAVWIWSKIFTFLENRSIINEFGHVFQKVNILNQIYILIIYLGPKLTFTHILKSKVLLRVV